MKLRSAVGTGILALRFGVSPCNGRSAPASTPDQAQAKSEVTPQPSPALTAGEEQVPTPTSTFHFRRAGATRRAMPADNSYYRGTAGVFIKSE